jgi:flagellar basal body L-ring protein FlgH
MADPTRIQGFLSGIATTNVQAGQILAALVAVTDGQIRSVAAAVSASGGSGTTVIDVQVNKQSLWTDPNNRPTMVGGAAGRFTGGRLPNHRAVRVGDIVTIVVATAGNHSGVVATVAIEQP